jgi:hypothetical protein
MGSYGLQHLACLDTFCRVWLGLLLHRLTVPQEAITVLSPVSHLSVQIFEKPRHQRAEWFIVNVSKLYILPIADGKISSDPC